MKIKLTQILILILTLVFLALGFFFNAQTNFEKDRKSLIAKNFSSQEIMADVISRGIDFINGVAKFEDVNNDGFFIISTNAFTENTTYQPNYITSEENLTFAPISKQNFIEIQNAGLDSVSIDFNLNNYNPVMNLISFRLNNFEK